MVFYIHNEWTANKYVFKVIERADGMWFACNHTGRALLWMPTECITIAYILNIYTYTGEYSYKLWQYTVRCMKSGSQSLSPSFCIHTSLFFPTADSGLYRWSLKSDAASTGGKPTPAETENLKNPGTVEKPKVTSSYCWGNRIACSTALLGNFIAVIKWMILLVGGLSFSTEQACLLTTASAKLV